MRKLAFLAPLGAVLAVAAGPALADPATVSVTIGPDLQEKTRDLGERDVREQADRLAEVVRRALADSGDLDPHRSISIGGAAIEGRITTADGRVLPVKYDWFSQSLAEVRGFSTWQDADRAYERLASRLADGRYVSR